jgi:hypothetical protein
VAESKLGIGLDQIMRDLLGETIRIHEKFSDMENLFLLWNLSQSETGHRIYSSPARFTRDGIHKNNVGNRRSTYRVDFFCESTQKSTLSLDTLRYS